MTTRDPDVGPLTAILAGRPLGADALTGADWARVLAQAESHDVTPFVHARLIARGITPPPAVAAALRQAYYDTAARNIRRFDELGKLLAAMHDAGIPVVVLKGAALAEFVYGDIALRPMFDTDVLVRPEDIAGAFRVLRAAGYAPEGPFDMAAEQTLNHAVPFLTPTGFRLDLHWTILTPRHRRGIDGQGLSALWARAQPVSFGGVPAWALCPTDLLLHLCLHVSVGHWFDKGLLAYVDIAEVTRRERVDAAGAQVDWAAFTDRARAWGIANGVRLALQLAGEWAGAVIPPHVLPSLNADPPDDATVAWVKFKALNHASLMMQNEEAQLIGRARTAGAHALLREALQPFGVVIAGFLRTPGRSWRNLRLYARRLAGYAGRNRQVLWRIVTRDKAVLADSHRDARLSEYLDQP